jgi:hypothetical protein
VLFLCNSEQNGGMKSIGQFVYLFEGDNYWNGVTRHVKFGVKVDHKQAEFFCIKFCL